MFNNNTKLNKKKEYLKFKIIKLLKIKKIKVNINNLKNQSQIMLITKNNKLFKNQI